MFLKLKTIENIEMLLCCQIPKPSLNRYENVLVEFFSFIIFYFELHISIIYGKYIKSTFLYSMNHPLKKIKI